MSAISISNPAVKRERLFTMKIESGSEAAKADSRYLSAILRQFARRHATKDVHDDLPVRRSPHLVHLVGGFPCMTDVTAPSLRLCCSAAFSVPPTPGGGPDCLQ